ncbi:MAG: adenylosuccinate synthetase [Candidatus Paceibacterota bacterium]
MVLEANSEAQLIEQKLMSYSTSLRSIYQQYWSGISQGTLKEWVEAVEWLNQNINIAKRNFFLSGGEVSQIFAGRKSVRVLVEGAQAVMLDNTYGTYPYVTSSNCLPSSAPAGLGLPGCAKKGRVIGVFKAYNTRVGNGLDTELLGGSGDLIREAGKEYGSTTGRDRRIGWLDLPDLMYACELAGVTDLFMTKVDVLSPDVTGTAFVCYSKDYQGIKYNLFEAWSCEGIRHDTDIKGPLSDFIRFVEEHLGEPIQAISTGEC